MRIVTSGSLHLDIDAYGSCVGYAELLQKQGTKAQAVSLAPFNKSIPPVVRQWPAPLRQNYKATPTDTYTVVDVSEPEYFEKFINMDKIDEVIDHHPGYEEYWHSRIGEGAKIEQVGAACTQIFEAWLQAGLLAQISEVSARLLMCGILDNTLNFGAVITTKRDHAAYDALKQYANLPDNWPELYFEYCQQSVVSDIARTLKNDTKLLTFTTFGDTPVVVGQFAAWHAKDVIYESEAIIQEQLSARGLNWFVNAISIGENKSYFVTDVPEVQRWLSELLGVLFEENVGVATRMWLRKEIIKQDIDLSK